MNLLFRGKQYPTPTASQQNRLQRNSELRALGMRLLWVNIVTSLLLLILSLYTDDGGCVYLDVEVGLLFYFDIPGCYEDADWWEHVFRG